MVKLISLPSYIDIPIWLKSLRLHKYQYIFENLSYDEMMEMSDETLAHMVSEDVIMVDKLYHFLHLH